MYRSWRLHGTVVLLRVILLELLAALLRELLFAERVERTGCDSRTDELEAGVDLEITIKFEPQGEGSPIQTIQNHTVKFL